ncbi:MAG: hypothetical protein HQL41_15945 [Alphaproteobacteria bacterium]|nr:hypothetical protein [Alphaproteobacteria bacterium]
MPAFVEVLNRFSLEPGRLEGWIVQGWVKPLRREDDGEWFFDDCDLARVELLCELTEMELGDEAMPVVLSLLDQLYATRAVLSRLGDALDHLPPEVRAEVLAVVGSKDPETR